MASRVSFSLGYTRNMGDFESLRIDVGTEVDQLPGETTAEAMARVKAFVADEFNGELERIERDVRQIRGK